MTSHIITAGGNRLEIPMDEDTRRHFAWPGSYTDEILRQINEAKFYEPLFAGRKDLVFFDIGANVGLVSLYAQDVCRFIVAIEPSSHFPLLCKLASPYKNILPVKVAMHSRDDPVSLCLCDTNSTGHSVAVKVGSNSMMVNGQRLSTILRPYLMASSFEKHPGRVDVIKVDIEGGEMDSLNETELQLVSGVVDAFYVECHPVGGINYPEECHIIKRRLENHGYSVEVVPDCRIIARRK